MLPGLVFTFNQVALQRGGQAAMRLNACGFIQHISGFVFCVFHGENPTLIERAVLAISQTG